jgi:hypothetical protein
MRHNKNNNSHKPRLEFNTVYYAYMPVKMAPINTNLSKQLATTINASPKRSPEGSPKGSNSNSNSSSSNRNLHDEASHQPQKQQQPQQPKQPKQQPPSQEFQDVNIAELPTYDTPISPTTFKSSNAWQHASVLLRKQRLQSTLKSSEERDQEEEQQGEDGEKANSARIGTNSCWGSLQSIFMLPKGLADLKAKNAIMLAAEQHPNNKQQPKQQLSRSSSSSIKSTEDRRTSLSATM